MLLSSYVQMKSVKGKRILHIPSICTTFHKLLAKEEDCSFNALNQIDSTKAEKYIVLLSSGQTECRKRNNGIFFNSVNANLDKFNIRV